MISNEMDAFILQGCIKLIKRVCKYIYIVTKDFYKIVVFLLSIH